MNNEIKKALYKEKPVAKLLFRISPYGNSAMAYVYEARTSIGIATFKVPVEEMSEITFKDEEPAQLLIRWLVTEDKEVYGE